MDKPRILAKGTFTPQDFVITQNPSNRLIDPVIESQLDDLWVEKLSRAQTNGQVCYNGVSYRG